MHEGALKRIVILFLLLYQASTGVWFEFEADSSASIDDVDFYLDKIESSSSFIDSNSYRSFNDLEDKMDFHSNLMTLSMLFCILFIAIIGFATYSRQEDSDWDYDDDYEDEEGPPLPQDKQSDDDWDDWN